MTDNEMVCKLDDLLFEMQQRINHCEQVSYNAALNAIVAQQQHQPRLVTECETVQYKNAAIADALKEVYSKLSQILEGWA